MESVEQIILRHSKRGMNILKDFLPENYCTLAAKNILSWKKGNIFLTTGFFVAGFAETDGPAGTVFLAEMLKKCSFTPIILTDEYCRNFFEEEKIETIYVPFEIEKNYFLTLVEKYSPVGIISCERCGINSKNDYANMKNISIKEKTSPIDKLFIDFYGKLPSVGIGDGGNEIGMGNLQNEISEKLSLVPCTVKTDFLVIATVSNWGAYALATEISKISGISLFDEYDFLFIAKFIKKTVEIGSVDGVTKEKSISVDGFPFEVEKEIFEALKRYSA